MAGRAEVEVDAACSADKMWNAILNSHKLFPKIFPEKFPSIDILSGDGKSPGTVRLVNYVVAAAGGGGGALSQSKEKIEACDNERKMMTYSVIGGGPSSLFKAFRATMHVVPKGYGRCAAKWSLEYEKAGGGDAPAQEIAVVKEQVAITLAGLANYLANN